MESEIRGLDLEKELTCSVSLNTTIHDTHKVAVKVKVKGGGKRCACDQMRQGTFTTGDLLAIPMSLSRSGGRYTKLWLLALY